jgi:hypothetical protein
MKLLKSLELLGLVNYLYFNTTGTNELLELINYWYATLLRLLKILKLLKLLKL